MPKISKILLLAVSVVLVLTVFLGVNSSGVSAATEPQDGAYRQINVYSEVLQHIQTDYVTSRTSRGDQWRAARAAGVAGCGLELPDAGGLQGLQGGQGRQGAGGDQCLQAVWLCDGGVGGAGKPGGQGGPGDGDIMEAIEAQDTRNISLAMIQLMLEGQPGSELTVAVVRPRKAEPDKITMTRTSTLRCRRLRRRCMRTPRFFI